MPPKSAPVVAPVVSTPPVEEKKKVQKKKVVKEEVKVETPVNVVVETKVEQKESVPDVTSQDEQKDVSGGEKIIGTLIEKVVNLNNEIKGLHTHLKQLAKEFDKQRKFIDKVQKKRDKAKKSPSGFAKPSKISDELCEFVGVPKGTEQSRTDITRFINSYVKEHNLNNPENRREIFPDKKLKAILNVKDGDKVSYFILQRLISHHFPPSQTKLTATTKA